MYIQMETTGDRVRQLRKECRMNQENFAVYCGLSRNTICNIENDTHTISSDSLDKIAVACNVTLDYLMYGDAISVPQKIECALTDERKFLDSFAEASPKLKIQIMKIWNVISAN